MVISKHTGETDCLEAAVVDAVEVIGAIACRDFTHEQETRRDGRIDKAQLWMVRQEASTLPKVGQRVIHIGINIPPP